MSSYTGSGRLKDIIAVFAMRTGDVQDVSTIEYCTQIQERDPVERMCHREISRQLTEDMMARAR